MMRAPSGTHTPAADPRALSRMLLRTLPRTRPLLPLLLLFALILAACGKGVEEKQELRTGAFVDTVLSADGVPVVYASDGEGKVTLLFVHGWAGSLASWRKQVTHYTDRYRVVTPDLPAHGASGRERDVFSMEAYGADVAAVANHIGLQRIILVGHSMGGAVILEAARRLPGRVIALVGIDTYQDIEEAWGDELVASILQGFREDFRGNVTSFVRQLFPPDADSALVAEVSRAMASGPPAQLTGAWEQLAHYDARPAFDELRLPLYCINSAMWPVNTAALSSRTTRFKLDIIEGVGHFPMLEDPFTFNAMLDTAISDALYYAENTGAQ